MFWKGLIVGYFLDDDHSGSGLGLAFLIIFIIILIALGVPLKLYYSVFDPVSEGVHADIEFSNKRLYDNVVNDFNHTEWSMQKKPHSTNYQTEIEINDSNYEIHESALWFYIDPDSSVKAANRDYAGPFRNRTSEVIEYIEEMNYITVKGKVDKKYSELTDYDKFAGVLSIIPYEEYYDTTWEETKDEMTFTFYNEKGELLFKEKISATESPKKIEFDLRDSEEILVRAETKLIDKFNGAILEPVLLKE